MQIKKTNNKISTYGKEQIYNDKANHWQLWQEHGVYHCNGFKNNSHFWQSFNDIVSARKFYKSLSTN